MADPTAPAAQATTAATTTTTAEAAPVAAISPEAAMAAKDAISSSSERPSHLLIDRPAPPRLRARPDGLVRAAEAMKAQLAAKAAEAPKTEPAKAEAARGGAPAVDAGKPAPAAEAKPADAAKEPAKEPPKVDPKAEEKQQRLSRGLAIIAEREEKVRVREKSLQAQLAQLEAKTKAATEDPDVQFTKTLKEALASYRTASRICAMDALLCQ